MADDDLTPRWLVTCLYNGAVTGSGRSVRLIVRGEDPLIALREGWKAAARLDKLSICITGLSAVLIPDEGS